MNGTLIACLCLIAIAYATPCQKPAAIKFLDNFNRHYPKLAGLDVPHNPDIIIGCKLDGTKQFVLLYPSNSSLRISIRSSLKSLMAYVEDQNISAPEMNVSWCIKSFLDLKYFMDYFNQRILKYNASDFSISDAHVRSITDDAQKVCQGLVTDSGSGEKINVRLEFSVLGSTMTTTITYDKASSSFATDQGTVHTESA